VLARLLKRQLAIPDRAIARAVRESDIEVAFGEVDLRTRFAVPWVGWIPDFQHVHYPEFFSAEELAARNDIYTRLADRASLVLLSSEDAYADFATFSPANARKGRVAPFVSLFPDEFFAPEPMAVVSKYRIEQPFVVVPNQWWRHKNHEVALRAAALMRDAGSDTRWVFTGALADYRNDKHISALLQLISELGLRDRVIILGALPRSEQVQLMRAADCIVQPSLFEGWSTVVEDAKSLGQRIVVSDIGVHREQRPPASLYFDPASPEDLAEKLTGMLGGEIARPSESAARAASVVRAKEFGERFVAICEEAVRGSRHD
jgi:glycosyltransferase involved in cell wall biosynthesis